MRLQVKGKNVEVSDSLKAYAEEKLGKLDKHLNDAARLELELRWRRTRPSPRARSPKATVWTKGPIFARGRARTT